MLCVDMFLFITYFYIIHSDIKGPVQIIFFGDFVVSYCHSSELIAMNNGFWFYELILFLGYQFSIEFKDQEIRLVID